VTICAELEEAREVFTSLLTILVASALMIVLAWILPPLQDYGWAKIFLFALLILLICIGRYVGDEA